MMSETAIQNALWLSLKASHRPIIPNYMPPGWWECDLFSVLKSRRVVEHEIKMTVADFKADAKKCEISYGERYYLRLDRSEPKVRNKHELLAQGASEGPNYFYFVLPELIAEAVHIPDWAGLKIAHVRKHGRWHIANIHRRAPLLHDKRIEAKAVAHVIETFQWRFWNQRLATPDH